MANDGGSAPAESGRGTVREWLRGISRKTLGEKNYYRLKELIRPFSPSLEWNKANWDGAHDWSTRGEEWSEPFGSSATQWHATLHPRLHPFLPARKILEIAPGHGRWTQFLLPYAGESYRTVDISTQCADFCRDAFAGRHPDFASRANDGMSLACVEEHRYDLVFSFDSLVHVSLDVMRSYCRQILDRLLADDGVAFLHHSNRAAYDRRAPFSRKPRHGRDPGVSAENVAECIEQNGGRILLQEIFDWRGTPALDSITLFGKKGAPAENAPPRITNNRFMQAAAYARECIEPYRLVKPDASRDPGAPGTK